MHIQKLLQQVYKSRAVFCFLTSTTNTVESVSGDMEEELLFAIMYLQFP